VNADQLPLIRRFHRPKEEKQSLVIVKQSLVIVPPCEYDNWLSCRDLERARAFPQLYPSELMAAEPALVIKTEAI